MATFVLIGLLASCASEPPPARAVLHRLNRVEYANTVRDLFGVPVEVTRRFPADDFALGFDNQAQALSISPLHVEMYDLAADTVLDVLFAEGTLPAERWIMEGEGPDVEADNGAIWDSSGWALFTEGGLHTSFWAPSAGQYRISVHAFAMQAGEELAQLGIEVDGAEAATFEVEAAFNGERGEPEVHEVEVALAQGLRRVSATFLNDLKLPPDIDRNLIIDQVRIVGPLGVPRPVPANQGLVLVCQPEALPELPPDRAEAACAEQIIRTFGIRAWRRPLDEVELGAKLQLYSTARLAGADWPEAIRTVLKAFLLSPHFVYRVEQSRHRGAGHWLDGYELATRLSYFLWSSMPDDRLLALAGTGALRDPAVLEAEARRMLTDRRAEALVDNLAGQWLSTRRIADVSPDPTLFPHFDDGLRGAMTNELTLLARSIFLGDHSLVELLTTTETYVDDRLADFYGLPASAPRAPAPASLPDRPGWFTRAGLLTAYSHPNKTSAVLRGRWVLGNLMCDEPPPPPDGISFDLEDQIIEGQSTPSQRAQLEQHRQNPVCYACHEVMDPIGFALEGFDAIGAARTVDEFGNALDLTGALPGAGAFDGPIEMGRLLAEDPRFARCAVEKTFVYALGRAVSEGEADLLDTLHTQFVEGDHRFVELVADIVRSDSFRRRGPYLPAEAP